MAATRGVSPPGAVQRKGMMGMTTTMARDLPLEEMFVQWRDGCDQGRTLAYVRAHALEGVLREAHRIARAVTAYPLDVTYFDDMGEDGAYPERYRPLEFIIDVPRAGAPRDEDPRRPVMRGNDGTGGTHAREPALHDLADVLDALFADRCPGLFDPVWVYY